MTQGFLYVYSFVMSIHFILSFSIP